MKTLVYIFHFDKGANQGSCHPLGVAHLEYTQIVKRVRNGCFSPEVLSGQVETVVDVGHRKFVAQSVNNDLIDSLLYQSGVRHQIAIPFGLADDIRNGVLELEWSSACPSYPIPKIKRRCPHCGVLS